MSCPQGRGPAREGCSHSETSPGTAGATWYPVDEPWALWAGVPCIGTTRQEESSGETSARNWEDSTRCFRGLDLFYYLIYLFSIRANEVELQERCKSLIGEWFFRALPDCSLCYENITARAGVGNFQAAVLTGWKEKHLPAQMSSQRKGRSRGFFHPQQFHRASCKSPGFPHTHTWEPSQGQAVAWHPQAWHHRAGVQDGWTEVPRLLSWDFCSPPMQEPTVVEDPCEELAHGKKNLVGKTPKSPSSPSQNALV